MAKKNKEDYEAIVAGLRKRNRERVAACRTRKRATAAKKAKKAVRSIALLERKKSQLSESRKKALRAKKRAERSAVIAQEKFRQHEGHVALGCCDQNK